jgi:hypothetical protein
VLCSTLKSAPKTDKGLVWRAESQAGIPSRMLCFCDFSRFLFLFSVPLIQRFLFFDLSTGAGARK